MPRTSPAAPPTTASCIDGAVAVDMARGQGARQGRDRLGARGRSRGLAAQAWTAARVLRGHAALRVARTHVRVGDDQLLGADRIFINVGGRAAVPDMPGVGRGRRTSTNSSHPGARHRARAPGGRRRQLHRARVRADVPPLRRRRSPSSRWARALIAPRGRGRLRRRRRTSCEGEGIAVRLSAECIRFAPHARRRGRRRRLRATGAPAVVGSHVLLAVGRRPNTDDLGLDAAGVATDARGYITVDDQLRTNVARHLGARRLQRPRRLHPHRLQRLRDRRRQPARRRAAPRQRPHPGLRALHRSAARPRRHDRGRGAQARPTGADRHAADDPRRPRRREGRDAGLHEGGRRRRDRTRSSARRSSAPAATRRSTASSTS